MKVILWLIIVGTFGTTDVVSSLHKDYSYNDDYQCAFVVHKDYSYSDEARDHL
jgi:hypothetical protein